MHVLVVQGLFLLLFIVVIVFCYDTVLVCGLVFVTIIFISQFHVSFHIAA